MKAGGEEGGHLRLFISWQSAGRSALPAHCHIPLHARPPRLHAYRTMPIHPRTLLTHPTRPPARPPPGLRNCMRIKLDMTAANKALRDPVCFRCNPTHHWRTGNKYKVGPRGGLLSRKQMESNGGHAEFRGGTSTRWGPGGLDSRGRRAWLSREQVHSDARGATYRGERVQGGPAGLVVTEIYREHIQSNARRARFMGAKQGAQGLLAKGRKGA